MWLEQVFFILVNMFLAIVFDAYAVLQERKTEAQPYPYRYSYWEEQVAQLWRASRRGPDLFVLTTKEMHALLTDHMALGAPNIGTKRVVQESTDAKLEHHVTATTVYETVITREHMASLGWPELHIRWLLSQIGVRDDQMETGSQSQQNAGSCTATVDLSVSDHHADRNKDIDDSIAQAVNEAKKDIMRQHRLELNALRKDILGAIAQIHEDSKRIPGNISSGSSIPSADPQAGKTPTSASALETPSGRRRRLS